MAILWPIIAGIGGLLAGNALSKKNKEPEVKTVPTLDDRQSQVMDEFAPYFRDVVSRAQSGSAIADAISKAGTTFDETVYDPTMSQFQRDVMPRISASYAGPGTFWGSDRARAETGAVQDIANQLAAARTSYISQAEQMAQANQQAEMNQALSFLGLPTTFTYGVPQQPGFVDQLLSMAPSLAAVLMKYSSGGSA